MFFILHKNNYILKIAVKKRLQFLPILTKFAYLVKQFIPQILSNKNVFT